MYFLSKNMIAWIPGLAVTHDDADVERRMNQSVCKTLVLLLLVVPGREGCMNEVRRMCLDP